MHFALSHEFPARTGGVILWCGHPGCPAGHAGWKPAPHQECMTRSRNFRLTGKFRRRQALAAIGSGAACTGGSTASTGWDPKSFTMRCTNVVAVHIVANLSATLDANRVVKKQDVAAGALVVTHDLGDFFRGESRDLNGTVVRTECGSVFESLCAVGVINSSASGPADTPACEVELRSASAFPSSTWERGPFPQTVIAVPRFITPQRSVAVLQFSFRSFRC